MKAQIHASMDALAAELVARSVEAAHDAVAARGRFVMALTGGSAAAALYPVLAQAPLPWANVHVVFGDERCVAPTDADSNFRLARETLLDRVPIPAEHVHRMQGESEPAAAARAYEAELLQLCDGAIDVVHVGMGPDGHICSLFPGHALLSEHERLVASLTDSPKPPPSRITLTLAALSRARALWFLVAGGAKAEAVRDALLVPGCTLPAAVASRSHAAAVWLLDEPAGRLLKSG